MTDSPLKENHPTTKSAPIDEWEKWIKWLTSGGAKNPDKVSKVTFTRGGIDYLNSELLRLLSKLRSESIAFGVNQSRNTWLKKIDEMKKTYKKNLAESIKEGKKEMYDGLEFGGYCQACGYVIDLCEKKPCRVRKILTKLSNT